jgi:hypothetical protein
MMEAESTSETSVNFYQTTRFNNPEHSHLHTHHCENLKSQFLLHLCSGINRKTACSLGSVRMAVFWVVAPCSLVEVHLRFRGPCCLHHQGTLMMEAARFSETLVNFYQTTRSYNPQDSYLHTHRRENLKSHLGSMNSSVA